MSLISWLNSLDRQVFTLIQGTTGHPIPDTIMLIARNPFTWIPLYLYMLYFAWTRAKDTAWIFVALSILCFALTDSISARLLKPFFNRPRPCHDPQLQAILSNLLDCGGWYSFPSSHASNHFGLAAFWFVSVKTISGKKWHWLWVWALVICYAQVYVGKHYPFDIVGGALFGSSIGWALSRAFKHYWKRRVIATKQIDQDNPKV